MRANICPRSYRYLILLSLILLSGADVSIINEALEKDVNVQTRNIGRGTES